MEWSPSEGQRPPRGGEHEGAAPPGTQWGDPSLAGQPPQSGTGQTNTKALLSLVFGILGFVAIPVIGGIIAIVFGNMAQQELRERPHETGEGMAKAGLILGWISVAIAVMVLVIVLLMLLAMGAAFRNAMVF